MRFVCCAKTSEIGLVKAAGYDLIEFSARLLSPISEAEAKEARRQLDDIGLACQNLNDYCGGTPAIVGPDYDGDAAVEYAKVVCERAAILGVQTIGIGAPMGRKLPAGYDPARADDQAREFLCRTCGVASAYGIRVLWESLNDQICNYGIHLDEAIRMIQDLAIPSLGIVLDQHHMALMHEPMSFIAPGKAYIWHAHISRLADTRRGFLVDEERAEYLAFLRTLREIGYDKNLSVEAVQGDVAGEAPRSLSMLKELWAEACA